MQGAEGLPKASAALELEHVGGELLRRGAAALVGEGITQRGKEHRARRKQDDARPEPLGQQQHRGDRAGVGELGLAVDHHLLGQEVAPGAEHAPSRGQPEELEREALQA